MQTTSDLYKSILADPAHLKEHRAFIAGTEYSQSRILSEVETALTRLEQKPRVSGGLFSKHTPSVGGTVSRQLDLMVLPQGEIPRMAEIRLETRLVLRDLLTGEITSASEWIPKGTFFIDTRQPDSVSGALRIHAYDAMLKAEQRYIPEGAESTSWPRTMPAMAEDICYRMGVALDPRSAINEWNVEYPADLTMREILSYIAACHAGNFTITDAGQLRLVPLSGTGEGTDLGSAAAGLSDPPAFGAITGVQFHYDGKDTFFAGDETGRVLEIGAAWATQEIADAAVAALGGYAYQPYEAAGALLDPAAELGDSVTVGGLTGLLAAAETTFDALCAADISAPSDQEVEHEYHYEDRSLRQTRREVAKATAAIRVGVDEIEARVEGVEGDMSSVTQRVDSIRLEVSSATGADGQTYASITLQVGDQMYTGQILMEGNVNVSGQLSADALYAAMGDIADLTVDRLSTSRRIVKYLAGDTSDDNYITAVDEKLSFLSGVYNGGEEQARNPNRLKIYWESDPNGEGVAIGADGYPYLDGVRIFTTTAETDWPVMVYTYDELTKAKLAFEDEDGIYTPVLTMGAGNEQGLNKGRMVKGADGLELSYRANTGQTIGLYLNNDGYADLFGLRRTTGLNFSEFDRGVFYERIAGKSDRYQYTVQFDIAGNPVRITDPDGNECTLTW